MPISEAMPRPRRGYVRLDDLLSEQDRQSWARRREELERKNAERLKAARERAQEQFQRLMETRRQREKERAERAERDRASRKRFLESERERQETRARALAETPAVLSELFAIVGVGVMSRVARHITDCPIVEEFAMALGGQYGADLGRRLAQSGGD